MRVAFLGPPGTFSEEAAHSCPLLAGMDLLAFPTFPDVIGAYRAGDAEYAVIPVESSRGGPVNVVLDLLVSEPEPAQICRQVQLAVRHHVLIAAGSEDQRITRVLSHPQALDQCETFLQASLPDAQLVGTHSTADAAEQVSARPGWAAIGSRAAATRYNLTILVEDAHAYGGQERRPNTTRFWVLGPTDEKPTGSDQTSIAFIPKDAPDALYRALGCLAKRSLAVDRVINRPSPDPAHPYVYFLDFHGHRTDPQPAEALKALEALTETLWILGSYPTPTT